MKSDMRKAITSQSTILFILFLLILIPASLNAQTEEIAEFTVKAGSVDRINVPVGVSLENLPVGLQSGQVLQLYEVRDGEEHPITSQLDANGFQKSLRWILSGDTPAGTTRTFILKKESNSSSVNPKNSIRVTDSGEDLTLRIDGKNVLSYRHAVTSPPEGVSELYSRSGYIHPLWSPGGEVITRIQPPDHYHHYGIWNPWTRTDFEGREVDFWNLGDGEGTVRHEETLQTTSGQVYGGFETFLKHIDLSAPSGEKVALHEKWEVIAWNADPENNIWLIDFVSTLHPASQSPLTIKAYRYQGFSLRATEKWDDQTADLLTSQGYDKSNGNATRARWIDVNGVSEVQEGRSGVLFMTNPGNHDFPERLRLWPIDSNGGEENVYINFNPAQDKDWTLEPGKSYTLQYRMIVYDGEIDAETAERYWTSYANPPKVEVRSLNHLSGKKVLLYTKNGEGYVHDNIPYSVDAINKLGQENGFMVDVSDDPGLFTIENLKQYDALIFSNTNNEAFDTASQREALQQYIRQGGGFMGIHSASGSERDWPWFSKLVGGNFERHAPRQDFTVEVLDPTHTSTYFLPHRWEIQDDECYYLKELNPAMDVLLVADLTTVTDEQMSTFPGTNFGDQFPVAWSQEFDGGRQWYTSLGHRPEQYSDPLFVRHLLGGIKWVTSD
ncbi:MAG: DUF6807 family protein [Balneolaceae bacterium]|nr:DUF6807 family protein [Balneolaceae bacterium]MDR9408776.1 DUF6807 family protein [Balneolaceae bacterium]